MATNLKKNTSSNLSNIVANQENITQIKGKQPLVPRSRLAKRPVLGDIASNSVQVKSTAQPLKKNVTTKPSTINQTTKVQITKQKVATKPVQKKEETENKAALFSRYRNPFANLPPTGSVARTEDKTRIRDSKISELYAPVEIPPNVIDIDKKDKGIIYLVPEYINEIYKYLRYLEDEIPIQKDYLTGQEITPKMRAVLVNWLVEVQQQYHLLPETLHLCVAIIDLFLQKLRVITKDKLQLVGVTAMFIACKYEETYAPDISDFVFITDSTYSKEQILSMEKVMLRKLDFKLCRPISISFLRRYSKAATVTPMHHNFGKYFLDLALLEYNLCHVKPSLVAAAAAFISYSIYKCERGPCPQLWNDTLSFYSTYKYSDLEPYIPILASAILKTSKSKLQAIPEKFSSSELQHVSGRAELQSDVLKKLAKDI